MAGFSIVMLTLLLWPLILVVAAAALMVTAAIEFVTSAAFPCLIVSFVCGLLAAIDVIRILWRHFKEKEGFPLSWGLFKRPAILAVASFVMFVAMCVIAGSMVVAWYQSLG